MCKLGCQLSKIYHLVLTWRFPNKYCQMRDIIPDAVLPAWFAAPFAPLMFSLDSLQKKMCPQMHIDTFNQQKKSCHMGLSDCRSIYHMLTFYSAFQKRQLNIQSSSLCQHDTQANENCRKSRNIQNTKKKCKNCNQLKDSYAHKIV
jgi:hypothetical protein